MLSVFCDASDLSSTAERVPDIIVIGGYAIQKQFEANLVQAVEEAKRNVIDSERIPVKWNMKSLERVLEAQGRAAHLQKLTQSADILRQDMLDVLRSFNPVFFLSIIQSYSNRRITLLQTREQRVRFAFNAMLMRVGLYVRRNIALGLTDIFLDWPESEKAYPFIHEYTCAYEQGRTSRGIPYFCGPLKNLPFSPSCTFGVTAADERLQLADLFVGNAKEFLRQNLAGDSDTRNFANQEFIKSLPYFDREPGRPPFGRGITIDPPNSGFSARILSFISPHLVVRPRI